MTRTARIPAVIEDALWEAARARLPAAVLGGAALTAAVIDRSRRYTTERDALRSPTRGTAAAARVGPLVRGPAVRRAVGAAAGPVVARATLLEHEVGVVLVAVALVVRTVVEVPVLERRRAHGHLDVGVGLAGGAVADGHLLRR